MSTSQGRADVCLFGAALDTGNLGVSALGLSTLAALHRRLPLTFTVFDNGRGQRPMELELADEPLAIVRRGAWISRRLHRGESLWTMHAASRLAPQLNTNVRIVSAADTVLDISGGDSFTDLYGARTFHHVTLPKRIALQRNRPLVLLPQTYGPFVDTKLRRRARRILIDCDQAWARDDRSYERLGELLGADFDPARHRRGRDVAFVLPARAPDRYGTRRPDLAGGPLVGANVSGLLYNDAAMAVARFGLTVDYRQFVDDLLRRLVERGASVLLIPHVDGKPGESDVAACRQVAERHPSERIRIAGIGLDASEVKHLIAQLDWFIGARMHATIAALSSRVPASAIAYSDKVLGVFESCGLGHRVLDARQGATGELVEAALDGFEERDADRRTLRKTVPLIETEVEEQFDEISRLISRAVAAPTGGTT